MKTWKLVLIGLTLGAGAAAIQHAVWPAEKPRDFLVPGDQWLGEPVHDLPVELVQTSPMQTRAGCFWGRPGSHPFTGSPYSAMRAMFVEPDDALELKGQMTEPTRYGTRVYRSNLGVWTSQHKQEFSPVSAQAYGENIVCFGTTANFRSDDAIEAGWLYHVGDAWVAVWDACRNVDRLIPIADAAVASVPLYGSPKFGAPYGLSTIPPTRAQRRAAALLYPVVTGRPALVGLPIPRRPTKPGEEVPSEDVHDVPEPGTLALLFAGMGVGLYTLRRRAR